MVHSFVGAFRRSEREIWKRNAELGCEEFVSPQTNETMIKKSFELLGNRKKPGFAQTTFSRMIGTNPVIGRTILNPRLGEVVSVVYAGKALASAALMSTWEKYSPVIEMQSSVRSFLASCFKYDMLYFEKYMREVHQKKGGFYLERMIDPKRIGQTGTWQAVYGRWLEKINPFDPHHFLSLEAEDEKRLLGEEEEEERPGDAIPCSIAMPSVRLQFH